MSSDHAGPSLARLHWLRSSPWSIRARGARYAVSRSRVLDLETGELADRYSAWHGEALDPSRRDIPMPELLGIDGDPAAAKARCAEHARGG